MPIAAFSFTKLSAERMTPKGAKIQIENNVMVTEISDATRGSAKPGPKALKFSFTFSSKFNPDFGVISMDGEAIYVGEEKLLKDVLKEWKKDKRVKEEVLPEIMNIILHNCNIEAILLSKEIALPSPIPLPKVNMQDAPKK